MVACNDLMFARMYNISVVIPILSNTKLDYRIGNTLNA